MWKTDIFTIVIELVIIVCPKVIFNIMASKAVREAESESIVWFDFISHLFSLHRPASGVHTACPSHFQAVLFILVHITRTATNSEFTYAYMFVL